MPGKAQSLILAYVLKTGIKPPNKWWPLKGLGLECLTWHIELQFVSIYLFLTKKKPLG